MMNRYDEIFQIFESQKQEISKLTDKVNELEETNAFLITILEKSQTLPPIYDPNLIRKDKAAAIEREYSLKSFRDKQSNFDSTHCETTLNDSYDGNLATNNNPNSIRWSTDSSSYKKSNKSDTIIKPFQNVSISDEMSSKSAELKSAISNEKLNNLKLRISHTSPIRRQSMKCLFGTDNNKNNLIRISKDCSIDLKTSNSDSSDNEKDFLDSVIAKSVNEIISETEVIPLSKRNDNKFHIFPKMSESITNTIVSEPLKNKNLKKALDNLIDTLQNSNRINNSNELEDGLPHSEDSASYQSDLMHSNYVNELLTNKEKYTSDINDKHSQMKLLLNTQMFKADLLHKSLEENNRIIFENGKKLSQINSSNLSPHVNSLSKLEEIAEISDTKSFTKSSAKSSTKSSSLSEDSNITPQNELNNVQNQINNEINVPIQPKSSKNLKLYRQMELSRLNCNHNEVFKNPKVHIGFVKFTALVKGYIVRTLCETDKVQNIIITIKDTAQLAIKLRQERLSGDCSQSDECNPYNFVTRRNNQEILSFQQRLVHQIKAALTELHEVFFEYPSALQMRLVRHHIDQLMSTNAKNPQYDKENYVAGQSTVEITKHRPTAQLSSATVKRRQKLALRCANSKEIGNKTPNTGGSSRKSIYTTSHGCRGYISGTYSRATNLQSKISTDRKFRTNNVSRRRGETRTIVKSSINKIFTNVKSNQCAVENKQIKTIETNSNKTIPGINKTFETVTNNKTNLELHVQPQQQQQQSPQEKPNTLPLSQQWIPPKNITTSICNQTAINPTFSRNNFINVKSTANQNTYKPITNDGDTIEDSFNSNKFQLAILPRTDLQDKDSVTNNTEMPDWRSQTYTISDIKRLNPDKSYDNETSAKVWSKRSNNSDNTSNRSPNSDFNEHSVSRVEVDINDADISYLCQNNSHYNDYNDPTDSPNIVLVDIAQNHKVTESYSHEINNKAHITPSYQHSSSNKPNTRNFSFTKHPLKSNTNNVVLSNALKNSKPDFYLSINNNNNISESQTPFKIRKRIVACSTLYSSTVSHS